jgi:hypothetical protein
MMISLQAKDNPRELDYSYEGISLKSSNFKIDYSENVLHADLVERDLNINSVSFFAGAVPREIEINKYFIGLNKISYKLFKLDNMSVSKVSFKQLVNKTNEFAFRVGKETYKTFEQISVSKSNYKMYSDSYMSLWRQGKRNSINDEADFAYKVSKDVNIYDRMVRLGYAYERPVYFKEGVALNLYDRRTNLYDVGVGVDKEAEPIRFEDNVSIGKNPGAVRIDELDVRLDMAPKGIDIDEYYKTVQKDSKGIAIEDPLFIGRTPKPIYFDNDLFVGMGAKPIYLDNKELSIGQEILDARLPYQWDWIDKGMHDGGVQYEYPWVDKDRHDSSMVYENLFINKDLKDTHMEYNILTIDKDSIGISMNDSVWIDKSSKGIRLDDNILLDTDGKPIYFDNDLFIGHDGVPINIDERYAFINHDAREIRIEDVEFVNLDPRWIRMFEQFYVGQFSRDITIEDDIRAVGDEKEIWFNEYKKDFQVIREAGDMRFTDGIGLKQNIKYGNLTYSGQNIRKNFKGTFIPEQSNFVKVIHYDGPDKPIPEMSGNIDELLLPHKDYRYSDFIDKLVFNDGTINMAYVKSYDSLTGEYTVSIPVQNPMTIYADIGRDYIDVDVTVLEIVIYLVRTVWKDNMYKYIAMSAQDSLKHLMVEVDKHLLEYGLDYHQMQEALRCMQLFRWYAEMAILNNCEYIMKFDTTKITVDYYNKDLGDFANIIVFDNMEISDEYIIEPIDSTQSCAITFKNDNVNPGLPLNLSFKLYNINTSSSISIIGNDGTQTVKSYPQGVHDLSFELEDRVIVRYIPSGKYQSINVANVIIDNKSIRGFTIQYKGKFGETNIVMQELLDSMLVVGEASTELKQKLGDVSPVTVAISTLMRYFELHHEDKLKGKRLITKKS